MRRVLATLVAISLVMSMFTGVFAPMPEARAASPAPVVLGMAGNFVILAKTGISTTGTTHVTGDIGVSPAAASFITGFALLAPPTTFTTSALVTGNVYAADYDPPTPTYMTTAIGDMQTAYTAAAGVTAPAPVVELGAGNIGGLTITPGVYKWGTGVIIPTDVTLSGGANDVWIFQIAQTLTLSDGIHVKLSGGAQAANIFWQVAGQTTLGTTSVFNGIILDQTAIVLNTGATLNGRALAQTQVTLDASIVSPALALTPATVTFGSSLTSGLVLNAGGSLAVPLFLSGDLEHAAYLDLYVEWYTLTTQGFNKIATVQVSPLSVSQTYVWNMPADLVANTAYLTASVWRNDGTNGGAGSYSTVRSGVMIITPSGSVAAVVASPVAGATLTGPTVPVTLNLGNLTNPWGNIMEIWFSTSGLSNSFVKVYRTDTGFASTMTPTVTLPTLASGTYTGCHFSVSVYVGGTTWRTNYSPTFTVIIP